VVYFSVPQEVHKYEQLGSNSSAGVAVVVVVVGGLRGVAFILAEEVKDLRRVHQIAAAALTTTAVPSKATKFVSEKHITAPVVFHGNILVECEYQDVSFIH
jgi:hypothetical protein